MLNLAQIKCLAVLAIFAIIGFGPVSPTCLIGLYVVSLRPRWFWRLACHVYDTTPIHESAVTENNALILRIKCFLSVLVLFVVDIAPIPVASPVAIMVVLTKPQWFYRLTTKIYGYR